VNAIEVRRLVKRYRGARQNALDGISLDVAEGEFFCLLGPNGAGKTTTASVLTTTLAPTSGEVRVCGRDLLSEEQAVRRAVGIVFQGPSLDANLTAEENIRLHAVLYGLYPWRPLHRWMPRAYREQVASLAGVLGVDGLLGRPVRTLSGGTRRKLEIVRALMHHPSVLFLDEPTAGLDPESRRSLWTYLEEERRQRGTTLFLTTHYLEEAEAAGTVCVLVGGRVIETGSPVELKGRHMRRELRVDAHDRTRLRAELVALGLTVTGAGPLAVALDGRKAQEIVRAITTDLTELSIVEPSLEETYLTLLREATDGGA
jgi:ABC-2 type transport system ATP-binding protein